MKTHITLVLLMVALLAGCRSSRQLAGPPSQAESGEASPRVCFAANFHCEMSNVQLSGMLRMQEDSVLWVSVSKVIELGRARFTPDSVLVYARATQQYLRGDYNDAYKVSGYRVDFEHLQRCLIDAYRKRKKEVDLVLPTSQRSDTLHLVFTHYTPVREQTYPLTIPNRARPM